MGRKIFTLLLVLIVAVLPCGCKSETTDYEWTETDFSFYDENSEEIAFAAPDESISLADVNTEKSGDFQTFRGAKIGMRATTAIENYDNVFGWFVMRSRSNTDEENSKDNEFQEKYPDIHDLVAHSSELLNDDEYLVLYAGFHVDENQDLIPCNMVGGVCEDDYEIWELERYDIQIEIESEKIRDIEISHEPAWSLN